MHGLSLKRNMRASDDLNKIYKQFTLQDKPSERTYKITTVSALKNTAMLKKFTVYCPSHLI